MRIGMVSKFGSPDGLCVRVQAVVNGLTQNGHEVHAFTQAKRVDGLPTERVHSFPAIALNPHFYLDAPTAVRLIAQRSIEHDIEVLHVQMNSSSTEFLLPRFRGALPPMVVTFHLAYAQGSSLTNTLFGIAWRASLSAVRRYDHIVLVDPGQRDIFIVEGVPEEKLTVISNGVDTDLFSPPRERHDRDHVEFVYVGRLSVDKGVKLLVEAFREYHEENPNTRLTLVGDGMLKFWMLDEIRSGMIRWFGSIRHEQVPEVLRTGDVFVIPQNIGGLGLSVIEAMSCGLPVVTTAIGETCRLLGEDEGVLVEANNRQALVDAMRLLAEDQQLRQSMGKKCREKVLRDYSWSRQIGLLEEVYRRVAD